MPQTFILHQAIGSKQCLHTLQITDILNNWLHDDFQLSSRLHTVAAEKLVMQERHPQPREMPLLRELSWKGLALVTSLPEVRTEAYNLKTDFMPWTSHGFLTSTILSWKLACHRKYTFYMLWDPSDGLIPQTKLKSTLEEDIICKW